ncbi:hypothetical protein BaRGS_00014863 [Batillaria attramentaria]|uniref:Uncharacterized protein n=1 Tax=Batillaria attramentaria TaxID=370345 RepID=A0ABD0L3X9_9CAEN
MFHVHSWRVQLVTDFTVALTMPWHSGSVQAPASRYTNTSLVLVWLGSAYTFSLNDAACVKITLLNFDTARHLSQFLSVKFDVTLYNSQAFFGQTDRYHLPVLCRLCGSRNDKLLRPNYVLLVSKYRTQRPRTEGDSENNIRRQYSKHH